MCNPASFVITRRKVWWSKRTDSHEEIIKEYHLVQDGRTGPNVVRVEVTPPGGSFDAPLSQWVFRNDQDVFPSWYNRVRYEPMVRKALKAWVKSKVITAGAAELDEDSTTYVCGDARVNASGKALVVSSGRATVTAQDMVNVVARDMVQVYACGDAAVVAHDSVNVSAGDRVQVEAYDRVVVSAGGTAQVRAYAKTRVQAYDGVRVFAYSEASIAAYGRSHVSAMDRSTVEINEKSTAEVQGSVVVTKYSAGRCAVVLNSANCVLINRSRHGKPRMRAGKEKKHAQVTR